MEERPGRGRIRDALLIAGPTASGKSAMALALAEKLGGAIVNADSMQVYSGLRIVTARPDDAALARAPHHLYGHVDPGTDYSTGAWLRDVRKLLESGGLEGRRPIFVGGTGLYFRALTEGLSEMPDVPRAIRDKWDDHLLEDGAAKLHDLLSRRDPEAAQRLRRSDGQRIVRALAVLDASGQSILEWQKVRAEPLVDMQTARASRIDLAREALTARIDRRVDAMVADGAEDEVRVLLARELPAGKPVMKAIGVRELRTVIDGTTPLQEAVALMKIATRQYAKRQATWFRNQLGPEWTEVDAS